MADQVQQQLALRRDRTAIVASRVLRIAEPVLRRRGEGALRIGLDEGAEAGDRTLVVAALELVERSVVGALLGLASAGLPDRLAWMGAGLAAGALLGVFGLRRTTFEPTPQGLYYTPNAHLGIALSLLFIARIAYRLVEVLVRLSYLVADYPEIVELDVNPLIVTPERKVKDGKPIKYPAPEGPSEINATPVFWKNRIYVAVGQDPEHGEGVGLLHCIDATKTGDITATGQFGFFIQ